MTHDWITVRSLTEFTRDICRRKGCPAKAIRWLQDGKWQTRTSGPKECHG